MTFKDSVHSAFKQCFRIAGRASRSEFWFYTLFCFIVGALISVLFALPLPPALQQIISFVITIIVSIPNIALTVRRLHDVGKSGSWYVIVYIVLPIVTVPAASWSYILAFSAQSDWRITLLAALGICATAIGAIAILVFLLLDSQPGDNRYGPNPKDTKH